MGGERYKSRGIVLYAFKYQEVKLIVTMFMPGRGRCNFVVLVTGKAVKSRRFTPRTFFQPFNLLEFEGEAPSSDGMHRMSEVTHSPALTTIGVQPIKSVIIMMLSEILYRVAKDCDESFFYFMERAALTLDGIDSVVQAREIANFHLHFLVHLTIHLGYAPHNNYEEGTFFDIKEGEFVAEVPNHRLYFDSGNSQILSVLLGLGSDSLCSLPLNRDQRRSFLNAMVSYFGYHTEAIHRVSSIGILSDVF